MTQQTNIVKYCKNCKKYIDIDKFKTIKTKKYRPRAYPNICDKCYINMIKYCKICNSPIKNQNKHNTRRYCSIKCKMKNDCLLNKEYYSKCNEYWRSLNEKEQIQRMFLWSQKLNEKLDKLELKGKLEKENETIKQLEDIKEKINIERMKNEKNYSELNKLYKKRIIVINKLYGVSKK